MVLMKLLRIQTGLGDMIALAGLVNILARQDHLVVPVHEKYFSSCIEMFNEPENMTFFPLEHTATANLNRLTAATKGRYNEGRLGEALTALGALRCQERKFCAIHAASQVMAMTHLQPPPEADRDHYSWIYYMKGYDYEERFRSCPFPNRFCTSFQIEPPSQPYAFIHDDAVRNYPITFDPGLVIVRPTATSTASILRYCKLIEHATEIHVIDSAFYHLIEQLHPRGKLFFHRYVRRVHNAMWGDYNFHHDWTVFESPPNPQH